MNRLPLISAAVLACVLGLFVLLELGAFAGRQPAVVPARPAPIPAGAPVAARIPGGAAMGAQVQTILDRPLFSPSRRPAQAVAGSTELPRLAGIVIGPYGARAIFAVSGESRAIVAGPGTRAGPYLVRAVGTDGVAVTGPDGPQTLRPSYDRKTARYDASPGPSGVSPNPSILDLLRAHVQNGNGFKPLLPPSSFPQTAPGLQR